jgi:hypothetical protein
VCGDRPRRDPEQLCGPLRTEVQQDPKGDDLSLASRQPQDKGNELRIGKIAFRRGDVR